MKKNNFSSFLTPCPWPSTQPLSVIDYRKKGKWLKIMDWKVEMRDCKMKLN